VLDAGGRVSTRAKRALAAAVIASGIFFSLGPAAVSPAASGLCYATVQKPDTISSRVGSSGTVTCVLVVNVVAELCVGGPTTYECQDFPYTANAVDHRNVGARWLCGARGEYTATLTVTWDGSNTTRANPARAPGC
jgi:hypothetical protein